jgi:hypothetical protein
MATVIYDSEQRTTREGTCKFITSSDLCEAVHTAIDEPDRLATGSDCRIGE